MIRIDEIYENTFLPWVRKNLPHTGIIYHDQFGQSDPDSLQNNKSVDDETSFIYFFDQEPLILDLHQATFDNIDERYTFQLDKVWYKKLGIIVVSETSSDNIDYICKQRNLQPFYYFFHGWAALDWYRGYDRTFLIKHWTERKIRKTFFSANRIIGGLRQHRVLMLYHFARLGLMSNWISASAICGRPSNANLIDVSPAQIASTVVALGMSSVIDFNEWRSDTAPRAEIDYPTLAAIALSQARGILETIYAEPITAATATSDVQAVFKSAYASEPFVVVRDEAPTLRDVQRTNMVHLNARVVGGRVILVAAEDNLTKGASGQAIQNANLMLGLPETAGLLAG